MKWLHSNMTLRRGSKEPVRQTESITVNLTADTRAVSAAFAQLDRSLKAGRDTDTEATP
jgi:hypothetical protein